MNRRAQQRVVRGFEIGRRWLPDRELTEPQDAESVPELRRLLHSSVDVDVSELMADFHIEQGE